MSTRDGQDRRRGVPGVRGIGSVHMGWRHVLFANWPVRPGVVRDHVPSRLDVDTVDGRAWLSVVPFTNVDVRPTWLPAGWGWRLPELNLRTYVDGPAGRGVYFFSLDADGLVSVLGARLFHHLPYYYARISLSVTDETVTFRSRRRQPGARPIAFRARYAPDGKAATPTDGSLAAFLAERYRYYTESPDGTLRYAAVRHEPWSLAPARVDLEPGAVFAANGFAVPDADPVHLYSHGVDTVASSSRRA